jgi:hypothetical protein
MQVPTFISHSGVQAKSRALLATLFTALALAACGGGGGDAGGSTIASNTFSSGAITGFGSVIVNGVRYDDSLASVSNEDGEDDSASHSKDDLKLGMMVSVTGNSDKDANTGSANAISFGSQLKGPVQTITASITSGTGTATVTTGGSLVILGQTVIVGTNTVFDPLSLPNGFASIQLKDVLEVHGHLDAVANTLTATRINLEDDTHTYKITGNVVSGSLNTGAKSFKIGAETISYASILDPKKISVNLIEGITIKVTLATTQTTTGTWNATRIKPAAKKVQGNKNKAELEGMITAFTSPILFSVNGIPVDATNASPLKGSVTLALGVKVEVKGSLVNGVLIATKVKVEHDDDEDNGIELHGLVSSVNTGSQTFVLRGLTVSYAGTVTYAPTGFSATNLSDLNANVEVKGVLAPGGTMVQAKTIKFEN